MLPDTPPSRPSGDPSPLALTISSRWSASTISSTSSITNTSSFTTSSTTISHDDNNNTSNNLSIPSSPKFQYYPPYPSTSNTAFHTTPSEAFCTTQNSALVPREQYGTGCDAETGGDFYDVELPFIEEGEWTYYPRSPRREVAVYGVVENERGTRDRARKVLGRVLRVGEWFGLGRRDVFNGL